MCYNTYTKQQQEVTKMLITITNIKDPSKYAKFTWTEDLQNCDHLAINIEDSEFDAIIKAKAHEGAKIDGWIVNLEF